MKRAENDDNTQEGGGVTAPWSPMECTVERRRKKFRQMMDKAVSEIIQGEEMVIYQGGDFTDAARDEDVKTDADDCAL